MKNRVAIIAGVRTPMCKAGTLLKPLSAADLGTIVVRELLDRTGLPANHIDELIFGNVAQPANCANIARVIALEAGLPRETPAFTVQRNCASGAQALTTAADQICAGEAKAMIVGGVESMSNLPVLYRPELADFLAHFAQTKGLWGKLRLLSQLKARHLRPVLGVKVGLTDPVSGLIMGLTAERLAQEFHITRAEQDAYALLSHERATAAQATGRLAAEIAAVPIPPRYEVAEADNGPRANQSLSALKRLSPYFDRHNGTVTVGNACPLTDGACALLVMSADRAAELQLTPIGYLRDYAYAGCDPARMGLGPVFSTHRLLHKSGTTMRNLNVIELNEAFAAQLIANERAFASASFAAKELGAAQAVGELDRARLNPNGGAIALGHPVGMTGARLALTTLLELRRRNGGLGLATMCIGGGQGASLLMEAA